MRNPFLELGKPRLHNPQGEMFEGSFACQQAGCYSVVGQARYLEEVKVLTWVCEQDHINKVEGFELDG